MSVSSWLVTALALRPPGHILAHQIERPTTPPGRAALEILARARKVPRSLKTRTVCPSRIPRGAASRGWMVRLASPSRRTQTGWAGEGEVGKGGGGGGGEGGGGGGGGARPPAAVGGGPGGGARPPPPPAVRTEARTAPTASGSHHRRRGRRGRGGSGAPSLPARAARR